MAEQANKTSGSNEEARLAWTESSLSLLFQLKPVLWKIVVKPMKSHHNIMVPRLRKAMSEEQGEDDAKASKMLQTWFEIAYQGTPDEAVARADGFKGNPDFWEELRYRGFYEAQRELLKGDPERAAKLLNEARDALGLGQIEPGHFCLAIPVKISEPVLKTSSLTEKRTQFSQPPECAVKLEAPDERQVQPPQIAGASGRKAKKNKKSRRSMGNKNRKRAGRSPETPVSLDDGRSPSCRSAPSTSRPEESMNFIGIRQPERARLDTAGELPAPKISAVDEPTVRGLKENKSAPKVTSKPHKSKKKNRELTKRVEESTPTNRSGGWSDATRTLELEINLQPETSHSVAPKAETTSMRALFARAEHSLAQEVKTEPREETIPVVESNIDTHLAATPPLSLTDSPSHQGERLDGDVKIEKVTLPDEKEASPVETRLDSTITIPLSIDEQLSAAKLSLPTPPVDTHLLPGDAPAPPTGVHTEPDGDTQFGWQDSWLDEYVRIPVWAKSRQELCELPYFKSMQGGVYTRGNTVYGYLLGRFPSPRDAWCHQGRLIVSHGGGKNVLEDGDSKNGLGPKHQLGDDQLESDKSIKALLTAYRMFRPIVILAEADYEHLRQFNLKQGYARDASYYVLGHYAIVAAWAEREEIELQGSTSIHTRWKFAFQYIEEDQGPPWWTQTPGIPMTKPEHSSKLITHSKQERRKFNRPVEAARLGVSEISVDSFPEFKVLCEFCGTLSPQVYQCWRVCLNPDCSFFWLTSNGQQVPQSQLLFNPEFLSLRTLPEQLRGIPYPIIPEHPDWQKRRDGESIFNRHFWAGACCHRCGRVSCRQSWQYWQCLTCGLQNHQSQPQIYPSSSLISPLHCEAQGDGDFNPYDLETKSRRFRYPNGESRLIIYYQLPENSGRIVHILNNPSATAEPDRLFDHFQQDAQEAGMFQRHAMKTHGVKGELYAQHFTHNAGAPYKYIAEAISTPFEECPLSVQGAMSHIQYLCEPVIKDKGTAFNELLSVAYAEGQEMNFHSDDEPGLGPIVAGLTLGGAAQMLFRHHVGWKKNLLYKNGPFRPSEARTLDVSNERVLEITLSHGDLLVMQGAEIQRQYEHAVFVRDNDLVRFAATARLIRPNPPVVANPSLANLKIKPEPAFIPRSSLHKAESSSYLDRSPNTRPIIPLHLPSEHQVDSSIRTRPTQCHSYH